MEFRAPPSPFHKMRSPAFPPRRPSALLRFLIPAVLIFVVFYYLSGPSSSLTESEYESIPARPPLQPPHDVTKTPPATSPQDQETIQHDRPAKDKTTTTKQALDKAPSAKSTSTKITTTKPTTKPTHSYANAAPFATGTHPIDSLVRDADMEFNDLLSKESHTVIDAAAAYRARRGRHPPPGFQEWYEFAERHDAVIVEEFWDQIYHDLEPFWALPAPLIRKSAWEFEMTIKIRDGNATATSDWFWTQIWLKMIKTIEHLLPDMDIALNAMDEPRLVVPWEQMSQYMFEAEKTRDMAEPRSVIEEFQTLPEPGEGSDRSEVVPKKNWEKTLPYWKVAVRGCAPDSPAGEAAIQTDFDQRPKIDAKLAAPHMRDGYVSNYTMSTEICHQPDLQGLNGIFVEPLTVSATENLFPMFGGSKLAVNNEILLPAPMYWNEEERFTGGNDHGGPWAQKRSGVVWRGVATGGRNRADNWRAFQRHRFVAMNNATELSQAEGRVSAPKPLNFDLPDVSTYSVRAREEHRMGEWVSAWADVSFVDLFCAHKEEKGRCNYTGEHFAVTEGMKMAKQFAYKFLPDIDGNSFSGRYLGFLRSTSLPIKATVWREWHDSRIVAWKHFVPMDSRYSDWFGIMQYFLGYNPGPKGGQGEDGAAAARISGHDEVAEQIATAGKQWAERVLRKEDMQIYVLRLLLEYARVCDERREKMGWVGDLLPGKHED